MSTPSAAQRVEQWRDRAGPGLLVAVEHHRLGAQRRDRRDEPQHRARQPAVHPWRRRAGAIAPLTVSSVSSPSTVTPSARTAPIIRSVSRLRSAPLMVDVPCAVASAASTRARLVCDFEPGTVTVACTGLGVVGAFQLLTASILPCRRFLPPWDVCVGDSR